jgi:ubiquinone/menaquinone biosynthesis C-methylase UbiE
MKALLSASDFYAHFPIFKLDSSGGLLEANPATCVLFDAAQGVLHPIYGANSPIIKKIREASEEAAFVEGLETSFDSSKFGRVGLRVTIVKLPRPFLEEPFEITVYAEVVEIASRQLFDVELRHELQQNLLWEVYAMSYDVVLPELDYYQEVVSRHVQALSRGGVQRVLDVGAGTGSVTGALLRAGCRVTAIDVSRAMLERLRAKLAPDEFKRAEILQGDAKDLSVLKDGSFDEVNILLALFDMSDPMAAIHEAMRVLKRGGRIIITEPRRKFNLSELLALAESCLRQKHLYEKLESDWTRVIQVNKKIDPAKRGMRLFIEDIADLLAANGFRINDIQDSHYGNCATVLAEKQT